MTFNQEGQTVGTQYNTVDASSRRQGYRTHYIHVKGPNGEATFERHSEWDAKELERAIRFAVEATGGTIKVTITPEK